VQIRAVLQPVKYGQGVILLTVKVPQFAPNAPEGHGWKRAPMGYLLPPKENAEAVARASCSMKDLIEEKFACVCGVWV